jgi:hypothetical protein
VNVHHVEVVLRHFNWHCPKAARCGSLLEGLRSLRFELRMEHGGQGDLRGSGHPSVIPYVHGRAFVLQCLWCCSSLGFHLVAPIVHLAFYSSRSGSYTVTQGLTSGPRVVGSLYCN